MKALIFDFDGLILDTESPSLYGWQKTFTSYGCELSFEEWAGWVGARSNRPYELLEAQLGQPVDRVAVRARQREYVMAAIAEKTVMPGVEDYIAEARRLGLKLGIASSSPCDWVTGHLSRLGLLDHFDAIRCFDHVEKAKPDPALYTLALEALDVTAADALVLEDSANGVLAAKRAGIFCVAVPNDMTREFDFSLADYRLESLADMSLGDLLAEAARRLNGHNGSAENEPG